MSRLLILGLKEVYFTNVTRHKKIFGLYSSAEHLLVLIRTNWNLLTDRKFKFRLYTLNMFSMYIQDFHIISLIFSGRFLYVMF